MGLSQSQWEAAFFWPLPFNVSSLCCCPKPKVQSVRTCTPSCVWTQSELLTEVNCTEKTMPTQKGRRRWWLLHLDRKGQEREPRASPKGSRHRGWGLAPHTGLTQGGWQGFPQHSSALPWSLGQGSWEVSGPGSRAAQHWERKGIMALDSYCRAFGNAQPDGRERRPGCSQKHCQKLCPGLEEQHTGALGSEGALSRLTSLLTAKHSKAWHPEHSWVCWWAQSRQIPTG